MYQRKPGDGTLWENGYKQKETHPDMKGDFMHIDGQEYEIAGWKKATKDGKPYLSLKIQTKRAKPDDRRPERGHPDPMSGFKAQKAVGDVPNDDLDSMDIPF